MTDGEILNQLEQWLWRQSEWNRIEFALHGYVEMD